MSFPNPVEQKSYDDINNKLSRVMKEVAEESMKRAVVEENSSSPDNLLTVSGDGTWKTRGHSLLIGVCTVIDAKTGDGDTKTFNALSENKPYGDDDLIQKIECVEHVQKRMGTRLRKLKLVHSKKKLSDGKTTGGKGRLTDSLIDKLAHYYVNAIRCSSTSVKEMRKAIWAVWVHSCSTDDEPMHWFCPTNPNTWWLCSDQPGLTHVLYHEIDTGDKGPVVSRPYRYDRVKQGIIDYHIEKMLREGTIRPIQSPYTSPVVLTRKNNDLPPDSPEAYRFTIDYRKLNAITKYPRYPLPVIDDLITNIPHTSVMSTLNLKSAYFQLVIRPNDI
ncbi:uncharacterized protein TNCV_2458501 [Trichonephila clavipes]|nr:uncharacterized protein TNCV_2458501 [Trichonephila clavipes]